MLVLAVSLLTFMPQVATYVSACGGKSFARRWFLLALCGTEVSFDEQIFEVKRNKEDKGEKEEKKEKKDTKSVKDLAADGWFTYVWVSADGVSGANRVRITMPHVRFSPQTMPYIVWIADPLCSVQYFLYQLACQFEFIPSRLIGTPGGPFSWEMWELLDLHVFAASVTAMVELLHRTEATISELFRGGAIGPLNLLQTKVIISS